LNESIGLAKLIQNTYCYTLRIRQNKIGEIFTMDIKVINIWKPIAFNESWQSAHASKLEGIIPSWHRKREHLKTDSEAYQLFVNRLKRQHAIETGIVENLYDLKEGITLTFVKEGFVESYLQHGDTNIPPKQLMAYLQDNFDAIDFVFEIVKNDRPIRKGFIKELHHLITRHQESAEGRDQFGNRLQIPLLKGTFKVRENNPTRADGTRFEYCPPIHVESEMDRLIEIYQQLTEKAVKPVVVAAWMHHALTQIHPFQDGNGRIARLLASLILIKNNLFPLTVQRNEKKKYIDALELADNGLPQSLIDFFCATQKRNIETALNLKKEFSNASLDTVAALFSQKLDQQQQQTEKIRQNKLSKNRMLLFQFVTDVLEEIKRELVKKLNGNAMLHLSNCRPNQQQALLFSPQIVVYADKFNYFFNRTLPRAWFKFGIDLKKQKKYQLIVTLHHYGYDDSTWAIGAILEYNESKTPLSEPNLTTILPLSIEPYTLSLDNERENIEKAFEDIRAFVQNIVMLTLAQIVSEIG
jgi:Fic family protein